MVATSLCEFCKSSEIGWLVYLHGPGTFTWKSLEMGRDVERLEYVDGKFIASCVEANLKDELIIDLIVEDRFDSIPVVIEQSTFLFYVFCVLSLGIYLV
jgi:hypothetical protein